MLKLGFVRKSKTEQRMFVDIYFEKLILGRRKSCLDKLNQWCEDNLALLLKDKAYSKYPYFEQIVKADYKKLKEIADYLDKRGSCSVLPTGLKTYIIDTLYDKGVDKKEFANNVGVTVCPYCNRNFINSGIRVSGGQLDHFFDKSTYPILAVSFYNLIPVCGSCNLRKWNQQFHHSPYDESVGADDLIIFSFVPLSMDFYFQTDAIEIILEYMNDEIKEDLERLELDKLYQIHRDQIIDLIHKAFIYDETYIKQLLEDYPHLFHDEAEIRALLTGGSMDEEDYIKRPLSKMITDISKELELI